MSVGGAATTSPPANAEITISGPVVIQSDWRPPVSVVFNGGNATVTVVGCVISARLRSDLLGSRTAVITGTSATITGVPQTISVDTAGETRRQVLVAATGGVVGEFTAVTVSGVSKVKGTDNCASYKGYAQKQVSSHAYTHTPRTRTHMQTHSHSYAHSLHPHTPHFLASIRAIPWRCKWFRNYLPAQSPPETGSSPALSSELWDAW